MTNAKKKNVRVFAPLGRKVIYSQIQNVTSSITSIISYMLTIIECGFNEQSKHRYHIIVLLQPGVCISVGVCSSASSVNTRVSYSSKTQLTHDHSFITSLFL